ncbi:hypothetical protein niasHT_024018 [Heterodera trifolii]|uniref:Uncharacterized protein n=1 Tax=Heterodera trifolii TaxID=157864 RepID=A0ABD2KPD1_9BILA
MSDAPANKRRSALAVTAPVAWRSHSAPPRKKWYRRAAAPLLNRHRSTTQQPGAELYDQMVARRLVSAIAAWHDLHASLLQLSLRTTDDDEGGETAADDDHRLLSAKRVSRVSSRASSICSTAGRKPASVRRVSGRRKGGQRQASARRAARNQLRVNDSRGPSPRSSFSAGSARSPPTAAGGGGVSPRRRLSPRSASRSSSVASGDDSSSDAEKHRGGALAVQGGGPSTSSLCSSSAHWPPHRFGISSQDELLDAGFSKSSSSVVAEQRPTAATWSATFAQSLQIRPSAVAQGIRSGGRRTTTARAAANGEIVLKHSVQLLDPSGALAPIQRHCASCCLLSPSQQPMLLSPPPFDHHFRQHRCFSVAKVDFDHRRCSCEEAEEDETTTQNEAEEAVPADEEEAADDTTSSEGAMSDTEMDALVVEEKNRPKFSLTEPELSPEQLRQLFPELSDHWRCLT